LSADAVEWEKTLHEWAQTRGYRADWYGTEAVDQALRYIPGLRDAGEFDDAFYRRTLAWIEGEGMGVQPGEDSIILVAVPRPAHIARFDYRGGSFDFALPPTYYNYGGFFEVVRKDLEGFFRDRASFQLQLRTLKAPLKTIATRTGFARYGRNNIAYLEGLGSYVQLMGFASRFPFRAPAPPGILEPAALELCARCEACRRACPTGAIGPDRFLLHAERCVTWFSEYEGPLPEAFGKARRPCLVGCMVCQEVCPANKGLLRLERLPIHFTQEETEYLLGTSPGAPPPSVREKVEALRCADCTLGASGPDPHFSRNLGAVLRA
jgi:epoxyqueuosine reductase